MSIRISQGQRAKLIIAVASLAFGGWCLATPESVISLAVRDEFQALPLASLAISAIGAQAIAAGLFAAFARFKSWTFPGFALSFLPILAVDWWLFANVDAFNHMILVHAGLLLAVFGLCARGFFALRREEISAEQMGLI